MLTQDQVKEAIEQMKTSCDLAEANGYTPVSARSVLNALGYNADVQQILQYIYEGGFTSCLDHEFQSQGCYPDFKPEYPSPDVCYWGPDQLKSRLNSLMYFNAA